MVHRHASLEPCFSQFYLFRLFFSPRSSFHLNWFSLSPWKLTHEFPCPDQFLVTNLRWIYLSLTFIASFSVSGSIHPKSVGISTLLCHSGQLRTVIGGSSDQFPDFPLHHGHRKFSRWRYRGKRWDKSRPIPFICFIYYLFTFYLLYYDTFRNYFVAWMKSHF